MKTFVGHHNLALSVLNQGEFKVGIEIIPRINDGFNGRIFLLLNVNPINFNCRDFKCKDTVVSLYDLVGGNLEVKLTGNKTYLGLPNRMTGECELLTRLCFWHRNLPTENAINYSFTAFIHAARLGVLAGFQLSFFFLPSRLCAVCCGESNLIF